MHPSSSATQITTSPGRVTRYSETGFAPREKISVSDVDLHLLQTRAGNAAYGSNGISHFLANTHPVICAIQNAIGKWVDPSATPDKVLKALKKA